MFERVVNLISAYAIPVLILVIPLYAALKKVKVYEVFCEGAVDGFHTSGRNIPFRGNACRRRYLPCLRSHGHSGEIFSPNQAFGMPGELLPLALMKSLSGSGATACSPTR